MTYYLATSRGKKIQSGIAASLGFVLGILIPQVFAHAEPESTHVSIHPGVFVIAKSVCRNNQGYRQVIVESESDLYTFVCNDGLSLKDSIVRVR